MTRDRIEAGRLYGQTTDGRLLELPADAGAADLWICRRVADFPRGLAPAGAAIGRCARCGAEIAYNPARVASVPPATPQVCMQCARIEPLPIEAGR